MYRGTSLCDDDFLVTIVVVVVDDGSVSGGTTVVSVVVDATVVVVVPVVEVVDAGVTVVVVAGAAAVTVKPVEASSVVLWARTVALPALAPAGTATLPENVGVPWESATPMRVATPDCTKSMTMQLGLSAAQAA